MTPDYRALLLELVEAWDSYRYMDAGDATDRMTEAVEKARAELAQPEPVGPTDEELMAAQDQAVASFPPIHPEAEPLSAVEYVRELEIRKARAVLARWGRPAITPIPVGERLPGAEDCDAEGMCWFWEPDCGYNGLKWALFDRSYGCNAQESAFTHWLPFHALPLPGQPAPAAPAP